MTQFYKWICWIKKLLSLDSKFISHSWEISRERHVSFARRSIARLSYAQTNRECDRVKENQRGSLPDESLPETKRKKRSARISFQLSSLLSSDHATLISILHKFWHFVCCSTVSWFRHRFRTIESQGTRLFFFFSLFRIFQLNHIYKQLSIDMSRS